MFTEQEPQISNTQEITIYANRKALSSLFIGCLLFVLLCIWAHSAPRNASDSVISLIGIAFFGLGTIGTIAFLIRSLFVREPLLIISDDGMFYHYPLYTRMVIKWENITQIYTRTQSFGITFFVVTVTNAKMSIILSHQNWFPKFLLRQNAGVICPPSWLLPTSAEELVMEIQQKYAQQIQRCNIRIQGSTS